MPMPAALILDFGEVLVTAQPPESVDQLALIADMHRDAFTSAYWTHRLAYDAGLPAADYWTRVLGGAARATPERIARLIEADAASWLHYREDVWRIAADFKRVGRTAMLSNGVPEIVARLRARRPLEPYFDEVVVSCEVGCTKPDAEIYQICLDRLGVPAASALFVDDRRENIEAADRLGLQTLLFGGDASIEVLKRTLGY